MSVWPAWVVRERDGTLSWFHVRLAFPDGARIDVLAVVCEGCVSIEDVRAEPALSLADLTVLADRIEGSLSRTRGVAAERADESVAQGAYEDEGGGENSGDAGDGLREECAPQAGGGEEGGGLCAGPRRARPAWPRGIEGRRMVAQQYRAAQEEGVDPVLAVMSATGRSRRRSLRLIAQARDGGFLTARHVRRE
ncbi:DUF6214 family protein [Streptomyces sp. MMG1121]|uniref:DUF6214 family protein n=1 Tax=Streptomyces sp. MMG1121 TaxID=1415544 RepID=UPI0006AF8789|nr:DUF6214 family protein [Streptomyces sp. MMG1121]